LFFDVVEQSAMLPCYNVEEGTGGWHKSKRHVAEQRTASTASSHPETSGAIGLRGLFLLLTFLLGKQKKSKNKALTLSPPQLVQFFSPTYRAIVLTIRTYYYEKETAEEPKRTHDQTDEDNLE
jgi:hypothetical protein